MILATTLLTLAIAQPLTAEKWEIKPPYAKDWKGKLQVTIGVQDNGQAIDVELTSGISIKEKTDKAYKGHIAWDDIMVGGQNIGMSFSGVCEINERGRLMKVESEFGDDFRRQLMWMFFIYPEKSVEKGDKWTVDVEKVKQEFEVVGDEKIGDDAVLKVAVKFSESTGETPTSATGFFWIAKDGRPLKLDLDVKNWPVPQQQTVSSEAKITAKFVK